MAERSGRGVFVVCRSSNPEGRPLQEAVTAGGCAVEDFLLAGLAQRNQRSRPIGARLASAGAVVGATLEPGVFPLTELGGPILAPGLGAQGATVADVARRFARAAPDSVLVSASRAVLAAGPSACALANAARNLAGALAEALPGAGSGQDPAPVRSRG
jgi:orotidine-5'-phosphate decarboxylase